MVGHHALHNSHATNTRLRDAGPLTTQALSICSYIYPCPCPSIHLSIYLSMDPSIHQSIYPSIHPSISSSRRARWSTAVLRCSTAACAPSQTGRRPTACAAPTTSSQSAQTLSLGLSLGLRALTRSLRLTLTLIRILTLALALALALTPTLVPTLTRCVQTLHAKGLGRLATAITNKSGSLGRGVKGMSIYGKFKGEHEDSD